MISHYLNRCRHIVSWANRNNIQWAYDQNIKHFRQEHCIQYVVYKMTASLSRFQCLNTLRPRQNGRHFSDDIFKCIFLNENVWIPIEISLKFVPKGPINNIPALVQIMAWRRSGDKPLSEPMMISLPTHTCVIRPQWVNKVQWQAVKYWLSPTVNALFTSYRSYTIVMFLAKICHKLAHVLTNVFCYPN